jgi:hypothetical protein
MNNTAPRNKQSVRRPPGQLSLFSCGVGQIGQEGRIRFTERSNSVLERSSTSNGRPRLPDQITPEVRDQREKKKSVFEVYYFLWVL